MNAAIPLARTTMKTRGDVIRPDTRRQWLSHLVLFVFLLRSLIPVGFMPDFQGASAGAFRIVICTSYGQQSVDLDANGHKLPSKPGSSSHQPCAFSISAVSDLPWTAVVIAQSTIAILVTQGSVFEVLPPARAGPAVGSRAPPSIS